MNKAIKNLTLLILLILTCSVFVLAQTETPKAPDWKTFTPENEEFSIETPVELKGSVYMARNPNDDTSRRYLNTLDGAYFYIFSDDPKKPLQFKYILNFVYGSNQKVADKSASGVEATLFEFADSVNFFHTILIVKGENHFYVFQAISPTEKNPVVERFFNSIKLNGKPFPEKLIEPKNEKDINISIDAELKQNVIPSQNGSGSGNGSGVGSGLGNGAVPVNKAPTPTTPNSTTTGVKILTKPRANYTDLARFYEIAGKVSLRVTFSANGTIGAISVISKLPFGLTEQAIAAARGMSFEPAMKNGVAYSVTKPVEYTFSIY